MRFPNIRITKMTDNNLHDSFEAIGQEGRLIRVTRMLPTDADLEHNEVVDIHERFTAYIKAKGITPGEVENELNLRIGRIKNLGKYVKQGHDNKKNALQRKIAIAINNWMELHARRDNVLCNPACVETAVVREALTVIEIVAETCCMGAIWGPSQIGKTHILESVAGDNRLGSPIYFRATDAHHRVGATCRLICEGLDLPISGPLDICFGRIVKRLKGTKRVLIFDEAERFSYRSLELIRDIHDLTKCGVLFCGKPAIYETLSFQKMGKWNEKLDQLTSRIVIRRDLTERTRRKKNPEPLFTKDDIRNLIRATGIQFRVSSDGLDYLHDRVCRLGGGGIKTLLIYLYLGIKYITTSGEDEITERIFAAVENTTLGNEDAAYIREYLANYGTEEVRRLTALG